MADLTIGDVLKLWKDSKFFILFGIPTIILGLEVVVASGDHWGGLSSALGIGGLIIAALGCTYLTFGIFGWSGARQWVKRRMQP